ncbi:MAG: glutathione S-transferase family protein [Alphaproteobacteria bacterium]
MLKIWGRDNSTNVQKVLWCCTELGLDYERIDAGMAFGVVDQSDYRALNPNGRIPTIEDDGFVLWESNAILRYLAGKYGGDEIWPGDLQSRASVDRWMDWQATSFWPALTPAFWGLIRTAEDQRDNAAIQGSVDQTEVLAKILDAQLDGKAYIAGEKFTLADLVMGINAHRWFELPIERPALTNLEAWYEKVNERPGFREHVLHPLT